MKIITLTFFTFISFNVLADTCSSNTSDNANEVSYNTPCEISGTILMATTEDVCLKLKEKISNHDHD